MKRIISILLTITMFFCVTSVIQLSASAAITDKVQSNMTYTDQYGEWTYDLIYFYDSEGTYCEGCKITGYDGVRVILKYRLR